MIKINPIIEKCVFIYFDIIYSQTHKISYRNKFEDSQILKHFLLSRQYFG